MTDVERHHALPGIGREGQERIGAGNVLVVGVGGLGAPAARYLAASGVERMSLCDFDKVSLSNIHRQILFGHYDEGAPKAATAAPRLEGAHPGLTVTVLDRPFEADDVAGHDVVLDCTDEPGTRALIHHACREAGIPLVWGTVEGWDGQLTTIVPDGPCVECLFPDGRVAADCETTGVWGPLAGTMGTMMASEAMRVLTGNPQLVGRLLVVDGLHMDFDSVRYVRNCTTCLSS